MNNSDSNRAKDRSIELLNSIKDQQSTESSQQQHEYECSKCGLTLVFNRTQTNVICPNDGRTMRRVR